MTNWHESINEEAPAGNISVVNKKPERKEGSLLLKKRPYFIYNYIVQMLFFLLIDKGAFTYINPNVFHD
jgi:hypothetical protein